MRAVVAGYFIVIDTVIRNIYFIVIENINFIVIGAFTLLLLETHQNITGALICAGIIDKMISIFESGLESFARYIFAETFAILGEKGIFSLERSLDPVSISE